MPDEHRDVAVALQHPVVADHEQASPMASTSAIGGPRDLPHARVVPALELVGQAEPVDHRDAEPVEQP